MNAYHTPVHAKVGSFGLQLFRARTTTAEREVMSSAPADEVYVRSSLIRVLEGVSDVAMAIGLGKCVGALV